MSDRTENAVKWIREKHAWGYEILKVRAPEIYELLKKHERTIKRVVIPLSAALFLLWLYLRPSGFKEKQVFADLVVKTVGGTAAFLAAYFTWKRLDVSQRTLEVSQEGQITDRFTRAIDQLGATHNGKKNIEVRLGGIYALERIAKDSKRDFNSIINILCSYLSQNSPFESTIENITEAEVCSGSIDEDIQATVQALSRLSVFGKYNNQDSIKIMNANLTGADLSSLRFINTEFVGINLDESKWHSSTIENCQFQFVKLTNSSFMFSNLSKVFLRRVNLSKSNFNKCNIYGLEVAWADFSSATFRFSTLRECKLVGGVGLSKKLLQEANVDQHTMLPAYLREDTE